MRERSVALKIPQPNMQELLTQYNTVIFLRYLQYVPRTLRDLRKEDDMLSSQSDRKNSGVRESQS